MLTKKPKTLKECYRLDETSLNLRGWSESLFRRGDLFFKIHLAVGVAGFFILLTLSSQYRYDSLDVILCGVAIGFLLLCLLVGVIVRARLRTLSILVSAKAHIVHNTRVTANLALFEAASKYGLKDDEDEFEDDCIAEEKFEIKEENVTEHIEEDFNGILNLETKTLRYILKDQTELFTESELEQIRSEIERRKNN